MAGSSNQGGRDLGEVLPADTALRRPVERDGPEWDRPCSGRRAADGMTGDWNDGPRDGLGSESGKRALMERALFPKRFSQRVSPAQFGLINRMKHARHQGTEQGSSTHASKRSIWRRSRHGERITCANHDSVPL